MRTRHLSQAQRQPFVPPTPSHQRRTLVTACEKQHLLRLHHSNRAGVWMVRACSRSSACSMNAFTAPHALSCSPQNKTERHWRTRSLMAQTASRCCRGEFITAIKILHVGDAIDSASSVSPSLQGHWFARPLWVDNKDKSSGISMTCWMYGCQQVGRPTSLWDASCAVLRREKK